MTLKAPLNNFIVEIENPFKDEIETKSGIKLFRDVTFLPELYAQTNGVVVSAPSNISPETDVQAGDVIFFSFMVVMDWVQRERDTPIFKNMFFHEEKKYWLVDETLAYFRVRDDKIKMLNGFVLLDFIEEEVESTLVIPDYLKKKVSTSKGYVIAAENGDIEIGDVIHFDGRFVETYEYWGREFFVLKKERIIAVEK